MGHDSSTPPDILVTNYSMLNVILMREQEDPIFERTRAWLEADESHALTLVVDELHGYRGTQGTEVALVLRNLLNRVGIDPDSNQLRCIGTSASLDSQTGRSYLEQFFGVDGDSFKIVPGTPIPIPEAKTLSRGQFESAAQLSGDTREAKLDELLIRNGPPARLAAACREGKETRATPLGIIDERLFDKPGEDTSALDAVLERSHYSLKSPLDSLSARMHSSG